MCVPRDVRVAREHDALVTIREVYWYQLPVAVKTGYGPKARGCTGVFIVHVTTPLARSKCCTPKPSTQQLEVVSDVGVAGPKNELNGPI